ncbi:MAG TPA: patatin-like phospholipase family protein [Thermoanaerobaculia bacterium]|nr:patatin-like phospholipase family protein [Thermoanaerobaculia bacterium]
MASWIPGARPRHPAPSGDLALVLSGGGARAAYQAGVLAGLAERLPKLRPTIFSGVSAGAINATFLAAHPGRFADACADLVGLWKRLTMDQVFESDLRSMASYFARWGVRLASGGVRAGRRVRSLVDTTPLHRFLARHLEGSDGTITGIRDNLRAGRIRAVTLTTLNYGTGETVVWVQGASAPTWRRARRISVRARLAVAHVMASSALPLVFPAIRLAGGWHGDGGIRLTAPFSPALKLGADRILAVSTRYVPPEDERPESVIHGYPPPAQIAGQMLNAVFLDQFDEDALKLERINALCRACDASAELGFRVVDTVVQRPSEDLARLAAGHERELPRPFRFATRGLGTRETESPDFLAMLLFLPEYLRTLLEVGERDAAGRAESVGRLLGLD